MVLYSSTTCPRCKVLKMKLDKAGIKYQINDNQDEMIEMGIKQIPKLQLDDGTMLDFAAAVKFVNGLDGEVTQQ